MTTTLISLRGERTRVTPCTGPFFSTAELQVFVEGTPAFLHLPDGSLLVYNDIAYEIGIDKNEDATRLALEALPQGTWLAGSVLHFVVSKHMLRVLKAHQNMALGYFQLYMARFECCDEWGKFLYDNIKLIYARDEVELHQHIAVVASTSAKGQSLLEVQKCEHGLMLPHEHLPAMVTVAREGIRHDGYRCHSV